jgi:oxalate decarboxylase/phosphoglucose isomerase-like protein (cupin superfamily)
MKSKLLELPKVLDQRGNLSFLQEDDQIPYPIERVYWIYDVPGGEIRGGHAFRNNQEVIVALSGSFDVVLNDGHSEQRYHLNRSYYGLYVPNMVWRSMENFSTNSLAVVVASIRYDSDDYIRDFDQFRKELKS